MAPAPVAETIGQPRRDRSVRQRSISVIGGNLGWVGVFGVEEVEEIDFGRGENWIAAGLGR